MESRRSFYLLIIQLGMRTMLAGHEPGWMVHNMQTQSAHKAYVFGWMH